MKENTEIYDEWGHFTAIPDEFIINADDLTPQSRWLFVLLRFHTNRKTKDAFPGYEMLQAKMNCSRQTLTNAIRELEANGWLTRQKRFGKSTIYRLVRKPHSPINQGNGETVPYNLGDSPLENRGQSPTEQGVTRQIEPDRINQREKSNPSLCTPAFLEEMRAKFPRKDIDHIYAKLLAWCEENGKRPSQTRLRSWIDNERVREADSGVRPEVPKAQIPDDWNARYAAKYGSTSTAAKRKVTE